MPHLNTLLSALSTTHVATTGELGHHTGIPLYAVEAVMQTAADQGPVLRLGKDRWELTGVG